MQWREEYGNLIEVNHFFCEANWPTDLYQCTAPRFEAAAPRHDSQVRGCLHINVCCLHVKRRWSPGKSDYHLEVSGWGQEERTHTERLGDRSTQSLMELSVVQEVAERQSCCRKSACVSISQTNPENEKKQQQKKLEQLWCAIRCGLHIRLYQCGRGCVCGWVGGLTVQVSHIVEGMYVGNTVCTSGADERGKVGV